MQPGTNPEDIHTILSRFNHWADHAPANGNSNAKSLKALKEAEPGVREIPYEEAMRMMRSRRSGARASAAQPPAEQPQPVVAEAVFPMAASSPAADMATGPEIRVRNRKKSMRRVVGQAPDAGPAARKAAKIAKPATPIAKKQPRRTGREAGAATEFRQVLAKTVGKARPAARPAAKKETGRDQRVSVRLSRTEEHHLQECAAKAGVTVSEYLRMRALESTAEPVMSASATPAARSEQATAATSPAIEKSKSGLGDWLSLLRNRFLASPSRFAERA